MPASANDLMTAVASFMGRDRSTFVKNGFDCLLQACNNARLYTERMIDFELSRVPVRLNNVSLTDGGNLDNCVLQSDNSTAVNVKKIKKAFVAVLNTTYPFPISFYGYDHWLRRIQRLWSRDCPEAYVNTTNLADRLSPQKPSVIQYARTVFLVPANDKVFGQTLTLYFSALRWLPKYGQTAVTGTATSTTTGKLVASAATFIASNVKIGMVVTNTTTGASAIITAVDSATSLTLNSNIFTSGNAFSILVANETDFLLESCFDWLLYRSVWELNFMLKEDERVNLSRDLINDAWAAVRGWNENLISQDTDDTDMD